MKPFEKRVSQVCVKKCLIGRKNAIFTIRNGSLIIHDEILLVSKFCLKNKLSSCCLRRLRRCRRRRGKKNKKAQNRIY